MTATPTHYNTHPTKLPCLKCGRTFHSADPTRNRLCPRCNLQNLQIDHK